MQEKVLLAWGDEGWAQCLYGYPSTHIVKPVSRPHPDMIFNEEYASRLARALGVAPYATWIETLEATDALVIERYDRDDVMPDRRLHQEDFNQEHGGRASLRRIAAVVAAVQGREGLGQLLVLLTLAIGNLDMYAKNISLIHPPDGSARLASAYYMAPLLHYPGIDGRMAMAINDVYEHSRLRREDIFAEAARWGMSDVRAEEVVEQTLTIIRTTIVQEEPHARAAPGLRDLIESTVARLRSPD